MTPATGARPLPTMTVFLLLFACAAAEHQSVSAAARPNVLLITVDDMNWDSTGVFGCRVPEITPHIDRLAAEGMRFKHAHVTIAICQPTRAVWMTGRYPHRSGALGFDPINRGVPTLVEALAGAGYHTGILAKVPHVVPTRKTAWDRMVAAAQLKVGRDPVLYHQHSLSFFQAAKAADKPFFLMANSQDPHRPFARSAQETGRSQPGRGRSKGKKKGSKFPGVSRTYRPDEITVPGFLPDLPDIRRELAQYHTSVHRADEIVGAVLRALDEANLRDNTLVMFLSDHGMPLPFAKTNCWLHSTRTPWIVRWPGIVAAGAHDQEHFISGIDLAPTVLDALQLPPLAGMDGHSFLPLLQGKRQAGRDHVFTHINRTAGRRGYPMRSVQDSRFGYIFNGWSDGQTVFKNESQAGLTMKAMTRAASSDPKIAARVKHFLYRTPEEFYDYEKDPDARRNLIDDPRHRDRIQAFRRRLHRHMKETGDPHLSDFEQKVSLGSGPPRR